MTLTNYRDVSRGEGFEFEFQCAACSKKWRSPFKPYRRGQLAGLFYKIGRYIDRHNVMTRMTTGVATSGEKQAREAALQDAIEMAEQRYAECQACSRVVCEDCWNPGAQLCEECAGHGGAASARGGGAHPSRSSAPAGEGAGALRCPNCSAEHSGGRFCPECGFDLAATHKSCPGCGATCARSARFCTDCGHGF